MSPDADYVFIARAALLDACFDKGAAQVKLALETLNAQADAGGK
jgi:hypothetical protein